MDEGERLTKLIERHKTDSDYLRAVNLRMGRDIVPAVMGDMRELGRNVLFFTGSRSMKAAGFTDKYKREMRDRGLEVQTYSGIHPNPTLGHMRGIVEYVQANGPFDMIFALGGGSVIDTAKAVAAGVHKDIWDVVMDRESIEEALPVIACATTSGTGSHLTPYTVVTSEATSEKRTLKHDLLLPKQSLVDLNVLDSLPPSVVAETGFDVLCHALEVYTRDDCTDAEREFAKRSLELVNKHLVNSYRHGAPIDREGMAYADAYAGLCLAMRGTHVPHAISHPISGRFSFISHGQSLAYIMPTTIAAQMALGDETVNTRFGEVSKLIGGNGNLAQTLLSWTQTLGISHEHQPVGLTEEDLDGIIEDTERYRVGSVKRCPAVGEQMVRYIPDIVRASFGNHGEVQRPDLFEALK
jgi:alcohol dehydrogenase